jgi:ABC-type multidrug transport system fused ATPase/permease subunit
MKGAVRWLSGGLSRLLLLSAFLSVGLSLWCQQASVPTPSLPSQSETISQLKEKLTEALALSLNLQRNLQLRIASFNSLSQQYIELSSKLEQLQKTLDASEMHLTQARSDLETTQKLLDSLAISLKQASLSLQDYKVATDQAVKSLEVQRNGWKVLGITFGVAAAGEAIYIIGHSLKAW